MSLQAVAFDLDGTLADSQPGVEAALRAAVDDVLPGADLSGLREAMGPPLPRMLEQLLPDEPGAHAEVIAGFRRRYDEDGWRETRAFPGIPEALDALRDAGLALHVVTNKPARPTARILGLPAFAGRFGEAVSLDSADPPHADKRRALGRLLADLGTPPRAVAYVGDSEEDRDAARATSCAFVAVAWGYGRAALTADAGDVGVAEDPSQLPTLLLALERHP